MNRTVIITAALACLALGSCTERTITRAYNSDPQANFDALWTILDERYCYFNERSLDWDGVYNRLCHRVAHVANVYQLFDLMTCLTDTLADGHVNLYAPFAVSSSSGWYDAYPRDFYEQLLSSERYLGHDARRINSLTYDTIGSVGYMRISSFSSAVASSTLHYVDYYFRHARGIIIDVRDNGGGSLDASAALAASFYSTATVTGYIRHKTGPGHSDFSRPEPMTTDPADRPIDWSGRRVVVLANRRSYSATNDFVLRMKSAPGATVVGGLTGGGGGMPLSEELPNGWMVRFSAVPMYDTGMHTTEFGIRPDHEVHITADDLAAGRDAILDYALSVISD